MKEHLTGNMKRNSLLPCLAVVAALAFSQNGRTDDFALDVSRGIIDGHICHNTSWAYSSCGRKIRLANYLG